MRALQKLQNSIQILIIVYPIQTNKLSILGNIWRATILPFSNLPLNAMFRTVFNTYEKRDCSLNCTPLENLRSGYTVQYCAQYCTQWLKCIVYPPQNLLRAIVESRPTSATLRATNFFVYPPSAAFRAIVSRKSQCSANQISHSNLTADLIFARGTFHVKRWFGLQKRKVL